MFVVIHKFTSNGATGLASYIPCIIVYLGMFS